jgi:GTP-binding protein HflX
VPIVALVGYTNAGKSALTNRICHSDLESNDAVFTSLSPHLRGMQLPSGLRALVLDSVGFITDLPAQLVDAFRATLEEIREAALLVHVRDISHPHAELQREAVLYQLRNMDLPPRLLAEHLEVWNKVGVVSGTRLFARRSPLHSTPLSCGFSQVDLLDRAEVARRLEACSPDGPRVFPLSATRGTGVTRFLRAIDEILSAQQGRRVYEVVFPQGDGEQLAFFYQRTKVLAHAEDEDAIPPRTVLKVSMDPATCVCLLSFSPLYHLFVVSLSHPSPMHLLSLSLSFPGLSTCQSTFTHRPRHAHYTRQFRPLGLTEVSMKPTRRPRRVV